MTDTAMPEAPDLGWVERLVELLAAVAHQLPTLTARVAHLEQRLTVVEDHLGAVADDEEAQQTNLDALTVRLATAEQQLAALQAAVEHLLPGPATTLTIQGAPVANPAISIDDANAKASFAWTDDHGDPTSPPVSPDGGSITVTLTSDNPAVATLAADPADPSGQTFTISPVALGDFNVTAAAVDDQGNPAVFASGSPITASPAAASIVAGPAGELTIQVAG